MAAAAPAYAVSTTCQPVTFDWSTQPPGQVFTRGTVGSTAITMALTAVSGLPTNGTVASTTQGNVAGEQLVLSLDPSPTSETTATFTFSAPVRDLQLQIRDIDSAPNSWSDRIQPSAGYTVIARGTAVQSEGTPTTFFANANIAPTADTGNVTIRYAGPITTFSLRYLQGASNGGTSALVTVGDLTFTPTLC
ncbi:hypothetical protein GCM10027425_15110 [Alteromonas gracilis]